MAFLTESAAWALLARKWVGAKKDDDGDFVVEIIDGLLSETVDLSAADLFTQRKITYQINVLMSDRVEGAPRNKRLWIRSTNAIAGRNARARLCKQFAKAARAEERKAKGKVKVKA